MSDYQGTQPVTTLSVASRSLRVTKQKTTKAVVRPSAASKLETSNTIWRFRCSYSEVNVFPLKIGNLENCNAYAIDVQEDRTPNAMHDK